MRIENSNVLDVTKNDGLDINGKVAIAGKTESAVKVEDNFSKDKGVIQATYEKPVADGTMDDVMAQADGLDAELMKNQMLVSSNTVSTKDSKQIEEDGFSLHSTDVKTIVTETDKIKMQLAKAGQDISCFGDGLSEDQLEEMTGSVALAAQMENTLQENALPVTDVNMTESLEALDQAENMADLSDGAVKYMLDNGLAPTVENLYMAEFSGSASYTQPQDQTINYNELQGQIESVIAEAGLAVNDTTVAYSQWMIGNGVALTAENLSYMTQLKDLSLPADKQQVMDAIAEAIDEGNRPKDAMLIDGYSMADQAEHAVDVIENATDLDLKYIVSNGLELTIENIDKAQKQNQLAAEQSNEGMSAAQTTATQVTSQAELDLITAQRQLEETRLAMTAEANYALLKQGISIDTTALSELVDQLKEAENNYYANLLSQGGVEPTSENVSLFAETVTKTTELQSMPAYTLGMKEYDLDTVNQIHQAGTVLQDTFAKANESYEALMTAPRKDLGDSITKAFQNVDDILEDLNLDTSEENERAVRILAYNNTEITTDSITKMKAADEEVQRTFANLTPAVVREMIKKGINPLDMSLSELNTAAEEIKSDLSGDDSEKFSEYLWKLEQNNEISADERSTYIGIYRLMNQVEKTDGAAVGALLNQGADVTMRNLLTNVRSMKHSNMDVSVDDAYGATDSMSTTATSITDQIEKGYQTNCMKEAFDMLTPEVARTVMNNTQWEELTPEQLLEQMRNADADQAAEEAYQNQQLQDLSNCAASSEEVFQMLADYDVPNTMYNVMAVQEMLTNRNGAFRKLFEQQEDVAKTDDTDSLEEAKAQMLEEYGEAIKTPQAMEEAQENLEEVAANVMDTMLVDNANVTSMKVKEMKLMRTQIELGSQFAQKESYTIPVLIQNQITSVNLQIVRDQEEKGQVDITFETENLGKVAAELKATTTGVSGYIASNREDTVALMQSNKDTLFLALSQGEKEADSNTLESDVNRPGSGMDVQFVVSGQLDLNHFMANSREKIDDTADKSNQVQTATLYQMAKSFIETVKSM